MKVAYVAGPYGAASIYETVQNIRAAEEVALEIWKLGMAALCPHKNTALFDGAAPDDVWLKGDLEFLRRSDVLVMVPGWANSSGSRREYFTARALDIPRYLWPMDKAELEEVAAKYERSYERTGTHPRV